MSRCILPVFGLSLLAVVLNLTGLWKGAGAFVAGLFALTMVLVLLSIVNNGDKSIR